MAKSITKSGVTYFQEFSDAREIKNSLYNMYKGVRLVKYGLGWAIQYSISGPYYPSDPTWTSYLNLKNGSV